MANVNPDYCVAIYKLYKCSQMEKARKLQLGLLELNAAVTTLYGIGGMKAAMELVGFHGGSPRRPILPATEDARRKIAEMVEATLKLFAEICGEGF